MAALWSRRGGSSRQAILLFVSMLMTPLLAEAQRPDREELEVAILLKIFDYVQWVQAPPQEGELVQFGVYDDRDMLKRVDDILGSSAKFSRFRTVLVDADAPPEALDGLRILYFPGAESERGAPDEELMRELRSRPILSAGRTDGFLGQGGILRFDLENDRVLFDIHAGRSQSNGISFHTGLLKLARMVDRTPPEPLPEEDVVPAPDMPHGQSEADGDGAQRPPNVLRSLEVAQYVDTWSVHAESSAGSRAIGRDVASGGVVPGTSKPGLAP